jgi:predicted Ser/Thr protein kinase
MAADQLGSVEPLDDGSGKPEALPGAFVPAPDRSPVAVPWLVASSETQVVPPIPSRRVEDADRALGEPGQAVEEGSNPVLELGISDSVSTERLRVAHGSWIGAADAADAARSEEGFLDRPEELGAWAVPPAPASGSVLGHIGEVVDRPQAPPLSVVQDEKIPVELPKQFGRYRILERLGKGAMGAIYLAHDTQLGRRVALKVPHLRGGDDDVAPDRCGLDRFYREARVAATLDHPNLCPVYDVGQIDGIPYLTMAYIQGRPLSKYIRRDRPMFQRRVAVMVRKLAQALEEAHYNGVVHRDLKPSNIMVNARGDLVIVDFGLVWRVGAQKERLTRVGLVVGTPMYMSPEQASGKVEAIGPGCDIYSLGVIMYELLTGRVPFEGPEALVLGQILFVEPPPPSTYRPDLDPRLEAICMKAIAKGLDQRFATMGEFAMALGDYLRAGEGVRLPIDVHPPGVAEEGPPEVVEEGAAGPSPRPDETAEVAPVGPEVPIEVTESATLWKTWRQWTAIIEHFALYRSHGHVNLNAYGTLYRSLLAACRARAAKARGPRQEFYLKLVELVLPWMTPRVLKSTDREILFSVLSYCRQFETELLDPTELLPEDEDVAKPWSGWWLAIGLFVASFVLALIWGYWPS